MYKRYKLFGIIYSLVVVSLVKMKLFGCDDCDDYDDDTVSIKYPVKTNLRNYWRCLAQRQYQLQLW